MSTYIPDSRINKSIDKIKSPDTKLVYDMEIIIISTVKIII